jgi:hypothetical protein
MPAICPKIVRGRVMRITKLDSCGVPVTGPSSIVTSTGFIAINASPQYEDATPIRVEAANGVLCINDPGCPQFSDIDLEMQFCGVDPDMFGLITGDPVVLDDATPTPNSVGFRIRGQDLCDTKFGLEVWSDISGQTCTAATKQYWYHLFPFVGNAQWGDFSIANDAVNFTISASTLVGSGWGVGPQNVINVLPGPIPGKLLTPITAQDHYHGQVTTLAPPTAACGATALA